MKRREFIAGVGGAVAWSIAARAQQTGAPPNRRQPIPTEPVIGFLHMFGPGLPARSFEAFRKGIEDGGFVEGANLFIELPLGWWQFRAIARFSR
jgi:putative ABC transport system substrate-binding protein